MSDTIERKRARKGSAYATFLALQAQETDDCILWPYALNEKGYGLIARSGLNRKTHRLSCEMAHGPAPFPEAEVAHSCRNRSCLNPKHLRWATRKENHADMIKDGTDFRGERHPSAKLSEADSWQIRFYARGGISQRVLAQHFKVTPTSVCAIVKGRRWRQ